MLKPLVIVGRLTKGLNPIVGFGFCSMVSSYEQAVNVAAMVIRTAAQYIFFIVVYVVVVYDNEPALLCKAFCLNQAVPV